MILQGIFVDLAGNFRPKKSGLPGNIRVFSKPGGTGSERVPSPIFEEKKRGEKKETEEKRGRNKMN